jgi:alpha-L-fucosidase
MSSPIPEPRVAEFERLALGMFVHWGLYSQLARGEWVQHAEKIPRDQYLELTKTFSAKDFDALKLVRFAKSVGMKYITHTTRHHEGFSLYDTQGLSELDVMHTPCGRDLVREFVDACNAEGIVPMLYHTTLDWNDARFKEDWDGYLQYLRDSVELLCTRYGKIGGLWFDGNWSRKDADWQESQLYAVIRKHQPDAIIINNTGIEEGGRTGQEEIDSVTFERGRPTPMDRTGKSKYIAAEMCHTMNFHWGVAAKDFNFLSPAHVIEEFCFARRAGANLLMNIGPLQHGALPPYEVAALTKVGEWIELHGGHEGPLFQGQPCGITGEGDDFGLAVGDDRYLFVTSLTPTSNTMAYGEGHRGPGPRKFMGVPEGYKYAKWMDNDEELKMESAAGTLTFEATGYPYGTNTVIRIAKLTR